MSGKILIGPRADRVKKNVAVQRYYQKLRVGLLVVAPWKALPRHKAVCYGKRMFPLWFICLLGLGSFHFVPCFPLFWVLWLSYGWHGFIKKTRWSKKWEIPSKNQNASLQNRRHWHWVDVRFCFRKIPSNYTSQLSGALYV